MSTDMGGNDNFQLVPHSVGDVAGQYETPLSTRIANYNAWTRGTRQSQDRTRSSFDYSDKVENLEEEITDQYLAHGTDWALFEYNPYGKEGDLHGFFNPNRRRLSDGGWAKITGTEVDLHDRDVIGGDEATGDGMMQYHNYPGEGYNSFGKKSADASGDKRWKWQGNSWVPN